MRAARLTRVAIAATLLGVALLPSGTGAQAIDTSCSPRAISGLNPAQSVLVERASQDPVVGCAALNASHRTGDVTVLPADTVRGNLVVLDGTLRIAGTVLGSAIVINGAVLVDTGGHVTGDVVAAEHGAAIVPAGVIDGELRTIDALEPTTDAPTVGAVSGTLASLTRTATWFGILILLGIGVLINAGDAMQRVNTALHAGFARNVQVGLIAQLALLPVLAVICLLLALTLIGILLIPFAIVAYVVAVLGLLVLGGLGAVQMVGSGIAPRRAAASERAARLQSLITGLLLLSIPWLGAAALHSMPIAAAAAGTLALGITWIAVTAGLGAALRTRGGTRSHEDPWGVRRPAPSGTPLPAIEPRAEWLTPTPLTGVVAVTRPTVGTGGAR